MSKLYCIWTNFRKTGNSCISLHKCILDSPRSTIYLCCAFVKIDTKFELNFFHFNYSLNFQGFLCVSVDNCFVFCGTLFGHLSSLAHVCYGGLPKRSQSDKVCTMPKLSASLFQDSMSNCTIFIGCNKRFLKLLIQIFCFLLL